MAAHFCPIDEIGIDRHRFGRDFGVVLDLSQYPVVVSDDLVRRLTDLQLCRLADFRRARTCVRRLARDLPAFDSVWIDGLVQLRRLTPYQARILDAGQAEQLRLGPYVILDKLGHGPHGTTFLAKPASRNEECVLKRLIVGAESRSDCRRRLQELREQTEGWKHAHIVVPRLVDSDADDFVTVASRYVPGLTMGELLVRRGRFPSPIVVEIARQLAVGLEALHARGLSHGDIGLSNVRLTSSGSAILVDCGLRPAVCPELTIHTNLALDAYDGVAPELIGTGSGANASSEMYSLGCLLWQLLTGRPPFPMADALMKLAAHQTQRIADVRTWAPDTPAELAETLFAMTSPDPNERPRSFDELLNRWGRPGFGSRSRLMNYRKTFDGAVPHFASTADPVANNRWPWIAVALFIASGAVLSLADGGRRNAILAIPQRMSAALQSYVSTMRTPDSHSTINPSTSDAEFPTGQLLPIPAPTADGEIKLTEEGPYDASSIATNAPQLTIRGARGASATIRINRESLHLKADSVNLINIRITCEDPNPPQELRALVLVQSQHLRIQDCEFQEASKQGELERPLPSMIAWRSQRFELPTESRIEIQNAVFRSNGSALCLAEVPTAVSVSNVLKLGNGACFAVLNRARARPVSFELTRLTLRDSGPLLSTSGEFAERNDAPEVEITANDCVFKPASMDRGLVEFRTERPRSNLKQAVRMSGEGSLIPEGLQMMVTLDAAHANSPVAIADADEQFDGLMPSDLGFAGPGDGSPKNSQLIRMTAPRSSQESSRPGVEPGRLPTFRSR